MALKRSAFFTSVLQSNPYLSDPERGMELVSRIISDEPKGRKSTYSRIDRLIDYKLTASIATLKLTNELELTARLMAISDRLVVPAKHRLLKACTIIGVGGKFSSGKSAFLNTMLGADATIQLPEEQTPSTAVPTYILRGSQESACAYTIKGSQLLLDKDAVEAISHAFQKEYGLGLAQYLSFLTVTSPDFVENVALLDTPGYNKPDSSMITSYSDESKAFSQLRSIDFLIWLTDVTNGTLTADDIAFIRRLGISSKILFLINKCDLRPEREIMDVVQRTEADAKRAGLSIFSVVPFSSIEPQRFDGKKGVNRFLEYAKKSSARIEDVEKALDEIFDSIATEFEQHKGALKDAQKSISSALFQVDDAFALKGLVEQYGQVSTELEALLRNKRNFQKTVQDIHNAMMKL